MHLATTDDGLTVCGKAPVKGRITSVPERSNCKECVKRIAAARNRKPRKVIPPQHKETLGAEAKEQLARLAEHARRVDESADGAGIRLNEWPLPLQPPFKSVAESLAVGVENAHRVIMQLSEKDPLTPDDVRANAEACRTLTHAWMYLPRPSILESPETSKAAVEPANGASMAVEPTT